MIFVDSNVIMYAVGRQHPLREPSRSFFLEHIESHEPLVTSAEVLQELLHAYLPVGRLETLDAALELASSCIQTVWEVTREDVLLARSLEPSHPALSARDLLHLACCQRRGVGRVKSHDRALAAAFPKSGQD